MAAANTGLADRCRLDDRCYAQASLIEVSTSTLHYVDLPAEDDLLTLRATDQSGMLLDSVELRR